MNKDDLRIVFMGTPDFAVPSLKAILQAGYNVVGVITAPDRKSGRGRKVSMSAVKEFALEKHLNILQPSNLKDSEFHNKLKELDPNLQIVVAFRMLPESVWGLPKLGTFNLHASLLPDYRGAAPINYAIINGEKETGLTTFFLDDKIDTGKILLQKKVEILDSDNAGSLHDRLMKLGSRLVLNSIELIVKGNTSLIAQSEINTKGELKKAFKINKDDCRIDWSKDSTIIRNFIRGLSPYPTAFSQLVCNDSQKTSTVKIYDVEIDNKQNSYEPGKIICEKNEMFVSTGHGRIKINELQMEGKKRLKVEDFLRGYPQISACSFR